MPVLEKGKMVHVSPSLKKGKSCKDVMMRLICAPKKRLSFHQLKRH